MVAAAVRQRMVQNTKDLVMKLLQARIVHIVEPRKRPTYVIVGTVGKGMHNRFTVRNMRRVGKF